MTNNAKYYSLFLFLSILAVLAVIANTLEALVPVGAMLLAAVVKFIFHLYSTSADINKKVESEKVVTYE